MSNETKTMTKHVEDTASAKTTTKSSSAVNVRYIAVTGMLSAIAFILMYLEIPLPMIMPDFIKFDFSNSCN